LRTVQKDLEGNFRAVLRASLSKLDLVTREEFDVQTRVLERTRARLEQLETRLQELERGAGQVGAASADRGPEPGPAGAAH
jgi:BMFP domain-containing protein YqiC